jgi:hypothetical protein
MRLRFVVLFAVFSGLLVERELLAGKVPMTAEQLQEESQLIVTGTVQSFRTKDEVSKDGSKDKIVLLDVLIESVQKGEDVGKIGETVVVRCWRPVKPGTDGYFWEQGNDFIPDTGGRAKFFLAKVYAEAWESHWPNGIEGLDGSPGMQIPTEPGNPPHPKAEVPAAQAKKASNESDESSLLPTTGIGIVNAILLLTWWVVRRSGKGAVRNDQ